MSYARFGADGSDVYVFPSTSGGVECCGCILQETEWVDDPGAPVFGGYFRRVGEIIKTHQLTTDEALAHMRAHVEAGHCVPAEALAEIEAERAEIDASLAGVA